MARVNSFVGEYHRYYKIKAGKNSDRWFFGKVSDVTLWRSLERNGAIGISLEDYMRGIFGKQVVNKWLRRIRSVKGLGSIVIQKDLSGLPNANSVDSEDLKRLLSNNRFNDKIQVSTK